MNSSPLPSPSSPPSPPENQGDNNPAASRPKRGVFKRFFIWLLLLRGSPRQIAMGFAIGIFVGCSPFWGLHMIIAAALATLFSVNRPAAVAAVWISNPFTVIPIYAMTYRVGYVFAKGQHPDSIVGVLRNVLHGSGVPWYDLIGQIQHVISVGEELLVPLLIGGLIVGLVAACLSYAGVRLALRLLGKRTRREIIKAE